MLRTVIAVVVLACGVAQCQQRLMAQQPPADSAFAILAAVEEATVSAVESAARSVVAIARVRRDRAPTAQVDSLRLGERFPFQEAPDSPDFVPSFFGSGVVVSEDGFIVTCAHVLEDPRENEYFVWLDKESYSARVVGRPAQAMASDPFSDLAVLKIDAESLRPARFSQLPLRRGQFVIALGNPQAIARDGQASASWGIVSNLKRVAPGEQGREELGKETIHHYGTLIQTDAKLNFGMSGGALVNLKGEVVGLTTALAANSGYERAAGFAIATDAMFLRVLEALKQGKLPEYGFLGIQPEDLRSAEKARGLRGARVSVVIPGLPGEAAGLRTDDVIFQVDQQPIRDRNDLFRELSLRGAGEEVMLFVQRGRAGRAAPEVLRLPASMSKKYVSTLRPGFALHSPTKWRGMLVEYATAVLSELTRGGVLSGRRDIPQLAVLSVDPDTPAWQAGLRPGYGLLAIDGRPVHSPEEFYQRVAERSDSVSLTIVHSGRRPESLLVKAPEADGPPGN
ncbi:MAG: trypsin-like peptidase domain-containing protein [Planctomycetales bacterium]|nr:trypsin-like peptidase domain-containing protein [Planctomycetales bacterium]